VYILAIALLLATGFGEVAWREDKRVVSCFQELVYQGTKVFFLGCSQCFDTVG